MIDGESIDIEENKLQWWHSVIRVTVEHGVECDECEEQLEDIASEILNATTTEGMDQGTGHAPR